MIPAYGARSRRLPLKKKALPEIEIKKAISDPIGSMYGIYANIGGNKLMINVTIYSIHGSYGYPHIINPQNHLKPMAISGTGKLGGTYQKKGRCNNVLRDMYPRKAWA